MQRNQAWASRSASLFGAASAMALVLAACTGAPAAAPSASTAGPQGAAGTPGGCQADRGSDEALVGKSEAEALALLQGCTWRIGERDGQSFPGTMDYRPDRRTLGIAGGKVKWVRRG